MKRSSKSIILCSLSLLGLCIAIPLSADTPHPLRIFNGVTPTTGPAEVDGLFNEQQLRDKIATVWSSPEGGEQQLPHGLLVDRKGVIVPAPPTTEPIDPLLAATMVSIHLDNVPTRRAITEFGKQTGVKLAMVQAQLWRMRSFPAVTMNADNIPLLEAVNELSCKTALVSVSNQNWGVALTVDPAHPRIPLNIQPDDRTMGPWEVSGPFAFEVQSITHSMQLNQDPANSPIQLFIETQHEPKLVLLGKDQNLTIEEAVDEKGNKLTSGNFSPMQPRRQGMWSELLFGGGRRRSIGPRQQIYWAQVDQPSWINLQCPVNPGKTIVRFRATARFLVQMKSQTIELPLTDDAAATEQVIAGIKCKVSPMKMQSSQQFQCSIQFTRDTMDQAKWDQFGSALSGISPRLFDTNGSLLPNMQRMGGNSQGNIVQANFYWWMQGNSDDAPHPGKLVVDIPTETRDIEVPVQFDNLPLP